MSTRPVDDRSRPVSGRVGESVGSAIRYWNRREGREEVEKVYGDRALRWLYETSLGRCLVAGVLSRPFVSRAFGWWQSTRWSRRRIPRFVEEFSIPIEEYEQRAFRSFNDFFARRFRPGARSFPAGEKEFGAFAEGRYFVAQELAEDGRLPVKGFELAPAELLGSVEEARPFERGAAFVARLCPTDYHRFHYPAAGRCERVWRVGSRLHSVNPVALEERPDILISNERSVSILETERFGRLAYVEVGALNVGRIVQTHPDHEPFARGEEKGHFLFGGSTVIVLAEPGALTIDADLLERSAQGQEVFLRLGERLARG